MNRAAFLTVLLISATFADSARSDRTFNGLSVFGDSLSAEEMPWGRPWPDFMGELILTEGGRYENLAVGGATSYTVLETISGYVARNPRLDPGGLYVIFAGTNDGRGDAGYIAEGVNTLHQSGAKYIMVSNLHDCPRRSPAVINAFNRDLQTRLKGSEANIIMVDTHSLINELNADPPSYGFGPDPVLTDGLHFSQRTSGIIAQYFNSILQAPVLISMLPELPRYAAHLNHNRLEFLLAGPASRAVRRFSLFADAGWNRLQIQARDEYSSLETADYNLILGGLFPFRDNFKSGLGLNLSSGKGEFGGGGGDLKMTGRIISFFAEYEIRDIFPITLILSRGWYDLDEISRPVVLGSHIRDCRGSTYADTAGLAVKARPRLIKTEKHDFGLRLGMDYGQVKVGGYSERGNTSTSMKYGSQKTDRTIGNLGVYYDYLHKYDRADIRFHLQGDYLFNSGGGSRTVSAGVSNFDIMFESPAYSSGNYGALQLSLGVDLILPSGLTGLCAYHYEHSDIASINSVRLGLKY